MPGFSSFVARSLRRILKMEDLRERPVPYGCMTCINACALRAYMPQGGISLVECSLLFLWRSCYVDGRFVMIGKLFSILQSG